MTYESIRTIALATDLSPSAAGATDQAFELAARLGVPLVVISVIEPRLTGVRRGLLPPPRIDQLREERSTLAAGVVARGRRLGVEVRFLIWEGDAAEGILEAATAEGADMIVIGSHGRGSLGRIFLGSVSEQVVRNASVPVLVVRPAPADGPSAVGGPGPNGPRDTTDRPPFRAV
jgi:nucleotide-binding universal stress UspA family protein